jgi:hypothetical protein
MIQAQNFGKLRVALSVAAWVCVLSTGCTSALKKKCEETNWFEYGESVAKDGRRTSTDTFIGQCDKEEANVDRSALSQGFQKGMAEYCTLDFAHRLGKQGTFLSLDLCSGPNEKQLMASHASGVQEYCQPGNGEAAGAEGRKYNQICPKDLEGAFLPEFRKGRKKYLAALVSRRENEIRDIDQDIFTLENKKLEMRGEVQRLGWDKNRLESMLGATNAVSDPATEQRKRDLSSLNLRIGSREREIRGADSSINGKRSDQKRLKDEMRDAQAELGTY